ncbi:MAG: hypothetical protein M1834_000157 [Cirrosporium novae-zelandiae]|nr:MAG: hypothetical protein M1834_000157 [Cirrosporium novae-zelandiae]
MINLNPGSKASVYLSRPPSHLFRFPPPPDPATLAPPTMPFDWLHPFNIPSAIYNIPLSVVYPLTIALVYITSVNIFNSVNNRRGRKPWGISRTKAFDYFVIAHNVFLALYSGWTCVGMYQGLRASVPTWYQRDGFAGMVDGFCKIHGPRGLGNAVTYNPETTSWGFTNSMIKLDGNNLPDSTDLGRMWNEGLAYYGWLFYLSKFYEVLDTVSRRIILTILKYSYYAICALGYHVPTVIKRTITTLQITQFVAGVSFAVTHLFIKYDIPVMVPYLFTKDNLSSAIPSAASTVSSVVSSVVASATASADMGTWLKKVGLRAAGQEGLAANIRNSEGQQFGIDAVHAMQDSKAREEIRYRLDYQAINCLDTAGEGFAVWFNICYLFPLTYLFGKFFVQSYLKRTQSSTRRHASSSGIGAAEKAGSDVFRDTKTQYQERPVHGYSKTNSVFATPTSEKAEIKGVEKPAPEPEVSSKSGLQMESFPSYSEVVIVGTEAEADKTKTEDEKEAEARMQQSSY